MIALVTLTYDPIGVAIFDETPDSTYQVHERRVTRTATLDGLCTISDMGYTASDNRFVVRLKSPAQSVVDRIIYMIKNYPLVKLASKDGVFEGVITPFKTHLEPLEFIFTVKRKLSD